VLIAMVVEPLVGVHGMAELTVRSLPNFDAPWLLVALLTLVPIWIGRRWAHRAFVWALGDPTHRAPPPQSIVPNPPDQTVEEDVYEKVLAAGSLRMPSPPATLVEGDGSEQHAK
jgi:hypothetical protein